MLRILQLTNRIPYPLHDGGSIGVHYYIEGYLNAGCRLSLLAMNTTRHWVDESTLPKIYERLEYFESVRVDNRIRPAAALANLFSGASYNITRFISKTYEAALAAALRRNDYDIVHLDGLYLAPYIPLIRKHTQAKVVMRLHNPEFRIWERLAAQAAPGLKKWYLGLLAQRLKAFEIARMPDYDLILALSEEDADFYKSHGCTTPIYIHPFGIHVDDVPYHPADISTPPSFYHLGAMDWLPNQESVDWLLEKVWPLVIAQSPDAKLYLAGRAMPQRYLGLQQRGVIVVGEVPDAAVFERDKNVLLVPLLSGGGVRIKIYRGLAEGKAVITTSVGVEGIAAADGHDVLIADTPEAFAAKILSLIHHPDNITALGTSARQLIERKYNAPDLMTALLDTYQSLLTT